MKLKTTAILAICGIMTSAAGAFAIPIAKPSAVADPATLSNATTNPGWAGNGEPGARATAGDTLLVDARLGHASLSKDSRGETLLFAQVSGSDDKLAAAAPPMNLAIVIDKSGSMKGERIANAMNAAVFALERMRDGDSVTVVAFDTRAELVVAPTRVNGGNRPSIERAIRSIRLGGDTCISCGLEEGMRELSSASVGALGGDHVSRMILLSDGATNAGIRDMSGIRAMANRMFGRGVSISTIGVDVDFDEKIMAAIANEANGRHYFVANAAGLPAVFSQEFDDLLASVAKESELTIELAPGVEVAEVFDRTFRREGNKIVVPFGTFAAKQEKTVLVKLRVPTDVAGNQPVADVKLAYRDLAKKSDASCSASLTLAIKNDGTEQKDMDPFVAARLERSRTAQTLTEANKLFESGRIAEARGKLAARKDDLKKTESQALAIAAATPSAAPRRAKRSLDVDFADQLGAVAAAEANFGSGGPATSTPPADDGRRFAAPPSAMPAPAPAGQAQATREGKAQVRANQEKASAFGF